MDRDIFDAPYWAEGTGKVFTKKPVRPSKFYRGPGMEKIRLDPNGIASNT
jgi:hypothetical protein